LSSERSGEKPQESDSGDRSGDKQMLRGEEPGKKVVIASVVAA
jgi:hypothetical protein